MKVEDEGREEKRGGGEGERKREEDGQEIYVNWVSEETGSFLRLLG